MKTKINKKVFETKITPTKSVDATEVDTTPIPVKLGFNPDLPANKQREFN